MDRSMIRALDHLLSVRSGRLTVLSLNDLSDMVPPVWFEELNVTSFRAFDGHRRRFVNAAMQSYNDADLVFYGLLGFTPLVFIQNLHAPRTASYLLLHGIEAWHNRGFLYSLAVRRLTGAISISRYTLQKYQKAYRIPDRQDSYVLPLSLDSDWTGRVLRQTMPDIDPIRSPIVLSVTRLTKGELKGIDMAIQALPRLLDEFPDLKYVVVGDGGDRHRLEKLAQSLSVTQAVEFRGFVPEHDLERAYAEADVFAMPSGCEGFGLVFLEAMACHKAVIAARSGGTPEVVSDGETGLLVDYGNVDQLVDATRRLLLDAELRRNLGEAGYKRVCERYTYENFIENLGVILSTIMAK